MPEENVDFEAACMRIRHATNRATAPERERERERERGAHVAETQNYSMFLALIVGSLRVTGGN